MEQTTTTFGPAFDKAKDGERLATQRGTIRELMLDGKWRTLFEIAEKTEQPEASISAQLRHLRKEEFGSYTVEKRRRAGGLWEYRVFKPKLVEAYLF